MTPNKSGYIELGIQKEYSRYISIWSTLQGILFILSVLYYPGWICLLIVLAVFAIAIYGSSDYSSYYFSQHMTRKYRELDREYRMLYPDNANEAINDDTKSILSWKYKIRYIQTGTVNNCVWIICCLVYGTLDFDKYQINGECNKLSNLSLIFSQLNIHFKER